MGLTSREGRGRAAERLKPPYLKAVGDATPCEFVLSWYTTTVGAEADNDIQIAHRSISAHHAQITRRRFDRYFIFDLQSKTGTFVNGRRVGRTKRIGSGDAIQFGDVRFVFFDTMNRYRDKASRRRLVWEFAVLLLFLLVGWEFDRIDRYLAQHSRTMQKHAVSRPLGSAKNGASSPTASTTPTPSLPGRVPSPQ
jgi:pSer/pThr/pTyr-binding forkhead associated (FHA) protein